MNQLNTSAPGVSAEDWDAYQPNPAAVRNRFIYPYAQWKHGREELEPIGGVDYYGGILIPAKYLPEDAALRGWATTNTKFSRKKEATYSTTTPNLAVLRWRFRWVLKNGDGKTPVTDFNAAAFSQLHVLAAMEGYDSSPVQLCLIGKSKTTPFTNARKTMMERVVNPANIARAERQRAANQLVTPLPHYAFWMPLAADAHQPIGEGSESSTVTPLILALPQMQGPALYKALFVGPDNLRKFENWYLESEGWETAWGKPQVNPIHVDEEEAEPEF